MPWTLSLDDGRDPSRRGEAPRRPPGAGVYPAYIAKAEAKGRTKAEVDRSFLVLGSAVGGVVAARRIHAGNR
jgi:hypothetical protein